MDKHIAMGVFVGSEAVLPLSKRWWPRRYRRRKRPSRYAYPCRVSFRCSDKDAVSQRTRQLDAQIPQAIQRS